MGGWLEVGIGGCCFVDGREGTGWSFGGKSLGEDGKVFVIVRHPALSILEIGYGMRIYVVYSNDNEI